MALEYYTFDTVLNELQLDEDELKRLVSEGQIRAYRDENRMKFRKDDIESLKKGKQTEPTIILPDGALDGGGGKQETILDLDGAVVEENTDSESADFQTDESSVPTVDFNAEENSGETLTEELVFDESEDLGGGDAGGGESEATEEISEESFDEMGSEATQKIDSESAFAEDEDLGMQTEPLEMSENEDAEATVVDRKGISDDEESEATEEVDEGEATVVSKPAKKGAVAKKPAPKKAAPAPRAAAKPEPAAAAAAAPVAAKPVGVLWVVLLGFVFVFYTMAALCLYDYSTYSFTGVSEMVGKQISENGMFFQEKWGDPDYKPKDALAEPEFLNTKGIEGGGQPVSGSGGLEK